MDHQVIRPLFHEQNKRETPTRVEVTATHSGRSYKERGVARFRILYKPSQSGLIPNTANQAMSQLVFNDPKLVTNKPHFANVNEIVKQRTVNFFEFMFLVISRKIPLAILDKDAPCVESAL